MKGFTCTPNILCFARWRGTVTWPRRVYGLLLASIPGICSGIVLSQEDFCNFRWRTLQPKRLCPEEDGFADGRDVGAQVSAGAVRILFCLGRHWCSRYWRIPRSIFKPAIITDCIFRSKPSEPTLQRITRRTSASSPTPRARRACLRSRRSTTSAPSPGWSGRSPGSRFVDRRTLWLPQCLLHPLLLVQSNIFLP